MHSLSKSKLMAFLQCKKRLWLEIHRPDLRHESEQTLINFKNGNSVGAIAHKIYDPQQQGYYLDVNSSECLFEKTHQYLQESKIIFEAALKYKDSFALADILIPTPEIEANSWHMIEVKSSTSVREYQRKDTAIQSYIAIASGIKLSKISLAHIDKTWTYRGDGDYNGLLKEVDLTQECLELHQEIPQWIEQAQAIILLENAPTIATGPQCTSPFECGFSNHCSIKKKPANFPLELLPQVGYNIRAWAQKNNCQEADQIPKNLLNDIQRRVVDCTINKRIYVNRTAAKTALNNPSPPVYFLDFEAIIDAIPVWPYTSPYKPLPFQFSLHIINAKWELEHQAFLNLSGKDPRLSLTQALLDACGRTGPIYVYNDAFEKARIRELMERFPQYRRNLEQILSRIVDLYPIARAHYYNPVQEGKWGLKSLLPAIAPKLSYDKLEGVQHGAHAIEAYHEATNPNTSEERKEEIRQQLLKYCALDTLALVKIWCFFTGNNPL